MHRGLNTLGRVAVLLALSGGIALVAQTQTGTLTVVVKNASGAPLAGVKVTLKSDKLQGERTGVTDAQGYFRAALLPPGAYTGVITQTGFKPASLTASVPLGGNTTAEAVLKAVESAEAVVTVVSSQSKVEKTEVSVTENYSQEDILKLPVGRTLAGITQLAPGVTTGAGGRAAIGGSATYENKFTVNGADINDNYFGTDVGLFIEDAIDETQVLTNGVSAEYGRFTGGVINAITKRGSNNFEGSLRAAMSNQNWNAVLPNIAANAQAGISAVDYRQEHRQQGQHHLHPHRGRPDHQGHPLVLLRRPHPEDAKPAPACPAPASSTPPRTKRPATRATSPGRSIPTTACSVPT